MAALLSGYLGCAAQEDAPGSSSGAAPSNVDAGGSAGSTSPSQPKGGGAGAGGTTASGGASAAPATGGNSLGGSASEASGGAAGEGGDTGGQPAGGTSAVEPDTTPPSMPGALQATDTTTSSVTVTWTGSTDDVGVVGYRLFNGNTEVTTLLGMTYTFKNLKPATAYTFGVEAYDAAQNYSARATKGVTTTALATCQSGSAVAKLSHGQGHTVSGSACLELNVNPAWNPVEILLEQTGGDPLTYSYQSCTGSGTGTVAMVLTLFEGENPGCNFFVQLSGNGTVFYYD